MVCVWGGGGGDGNNSYLGSECSQDSVFQCLAQFSHVPRDMALSQITFQQRLDKNTGAGDSGAGGNRVE